MTYEAARGLASHSSWLRLEGMVVVAETATGVYPDGLTASRVDFVLRATGPVEHLLLEAYYPPHHLQAATIDLRAGSSSASTTVEPGSYFVLTIPLVLAPYECASVSILCSDSINLFARGESDDRRDIGILILGLRAEARTNPNALSFVCNVCSSDLRLYSMDELHREGAPCPTCGANVRLRSLAYLAGKVLLGSTAPIADWPVRGGLVTYGISDWPGFSRYLAPKIGYVNTQYDREQYPRQLALDITMPPKELHGTADLIICSDVLEHVAPPARSAFDGLAKLLKPSGAVIFTVPYTLGSTIEHFPDLHEWRVEGDVGARVLVNTTLEGIEERFEHLVFHGGGERVLEMRVFGEKDIVAHFKRAGFSTVSTMEDDVMEYGIRYDNRCGRPMIASKSR